MDISKHDDNIMIPVGGLLNTGSICYLNSLLQSLLSCTSITEFFLSNKKRFVDGDNILAIEYINLINQFSNNTNNPIDPSGVFSALVKVLRKKYPQKKFGDGQEDVNEGFHMFLDSINDGGLYKLFMHRYKICIWCIDCNKQVSVQTDESCVVEISGDYIPLSNTTYHPINKQILEYMSKVSDYKCPSCGNTRCLRFYQISYAPEIIPVVFTKYHKKNKIDFPEHLSLPALTGGVLRYILVSKVEHSGGRNGGHYWVDCYRKNRQGEKKIFNVNDSSVMLGNFVPSRDTYMIFYHSV